MKTIIVPVSGGKDSQVVLSLALKTGHPILDGKEVRELANEECGYCSI